MTGQVPFARYWPHVGLVTTDGEKMAHSLENFTTIHDIVAKYDPMALRLFLLSTHYRAPLVFSEDGLIDKSRALDRLRGAAEGYDPVRPRHRPSGWRVTEMTSPPRWTMTSIRPAGLAFFSIWPGRSIADARPAMLTPRQARRCWSSWPLVLGLDLQSRASVTASPAEPYIDFLLDIRAQLREARQWALADQIRDGLKARGVVVEDQAGRSAWHWTRPGE